MREIDKNLTNVNFKGIPQVSTSGDNSSKNDSQPSVAVPEQREISDLKNVPAAFLGKSQVAPDSLEQDMKFLQKHPNLVQELNRSVDNYTQTHTPQETLKLLENMHQEFVVK